MIGGNHDSELETIGSEAAADLLSNATYLNNTATVLTVGEGDAQKRVRVFGSPSSHGTSGNLGFQSPLVAEAAREAITAMGRSQQKGGTDAAEGVQGEPPGAPCDRITAPRMPYPRHALPSPPACLSCAASPSPRMPPPAAQRPDVEVLMTHAKSPHIREAYAAAGLGLAAHLWGHAHGEYGACLESRSGSRVISACASIMDHRYRPRNLPVVIDLEL